MKTGDLSVQKTPTATDDAATKAYVDTKGFGTWVDKSASYGAQQAATDGFVIARGWSAGGEFTALGYTDANANPTTLRGWAASPTGGSDNSFCMPVKKNDYWKVVFSNYNSRAVYWIPFGN
jgi:hypothetical protein